MWFSFLFYFFIFNIQQLNNLFKFAKHYSIFKKFVRIESRFPIRQVMKETWKFVIFFHETKFFPEEIFALFNKNTPTTYGKRKTSMNRFVFNSSKIDVLEVLICVVSKLNFFIQCINFSWIKFWVNHLLVKNYFLL